jgi:hypothetical protein
MELPSTEAVSAIACRTQRRALGTCRRTEAAGGADGLLRLANAWHARVMPDEVLSHGFHPEHSQRPAAYWAESLGGSTTLRLLQRRDLCCADG